MNLKRWYTCRVVLKLKTSLCICFNTLTITLDDSIAQHDCNPNLGSARVNITRSCSRRTQYVAKHLLQAFSSDSSLQSGLPLQKSSLSTHSPLPHDNFPSGQTGSSVLRMGKTLRGSEKIVISVRPRDAHPPIVQDIEQVYRNPSNINRMTIECPYNKIFIALSINRYID